ncbi:MAG: hypothetical protein ACYCQI_11505 [Gammaproteobacteria bacterium]
MKLDEIGINDLLNFYKKKNLLIQEGNLLELIELKKLCPDLFIKEKEIEIDQLIDTTKYLIEMPHFKDLLREEKKRRLISVDFDEWYIGALAETLSRYEKVEYANINQVSRALVKEAIAKCQLIHQKQNTINVPDIFPYLSYLINEILNYFPDDKKELMFYRAMFKINGNVDIDSESINNFKQKLEDENNPISNCLKVEDQIRNEFEQMINTRLWPFRPLALADLPMFPNL